jgi:hypothetical protein
MKTFTFVLLVCFIVCIPTLTAFAASVNTEQAAKELAMTYAQKLGWQYGMPTSVTLNKNDFLGDRWEVRLSDSAELTFDQATGEFMTMIDYVRLHKLTEGDDVKLHVGQDEARVNATRYLTVFTMLDEIALDYEMQNRNTKLWSFHWVRTYCGIPYDSCAEGVSILISPVDGILTIYGRGFISARPKAAEIRVTQSDAVTLARQIAGLLGLQNSDSFSATATLKVVQRNNYWNEKPIYHYIYPGVPSQVAWVVTLNTDLFGPSELIFWIDATTGELLGGTQSMSGNGVAKRLTKKIIATHHAKVQKHPIRKLLKPRKPVVSASVTTPVVK